MCTNNDFADFLLNAYFDENGYIVDVDKDVFKLISKDITKEKDEKEEDFYERS